MADVDRQVPADLVEVGRVIEAYGLKGGLKILPYADRPDALLAAKTWWLSKSPEARPLQARPVDVLDARRHGSNVAAMWNGVADRDQAQAWRGWSILVPRSEFPAPAPDEIYWVDLIGCQLVGVDAGGNPIVLGTVAQVIDNGAHAVLSIERVEPVAPGQPTQPMLDAKGRVRDMLVPFVQAHIGAVDIEAKRIDSNWPADF